MMPIPVQTQSIALSKDDGANVKLSTASKSVTETLSFAPLFSASYVTVFLRNLRLLNLDEHPDWPSICAESFSTKGPQQNQKNRIRCVEWALYHLFEIWDVRGTQDVGTMLFGSSIAYDQR